ncbi:MAG: ribonuclease HIII [Armatimonadetes bacterium]|nr:ribonuclease HIII [Armatimonadota bacterium]
MDEGRIGVDESGKGDYFGPLVIAACYVGPEHLAELEGVRDSKRLTDGRAHQLAATIRRTCPHAVVAIGPAKYNELYAKMRNLNRLLAWGHARAIESVLEQHTADLIVSDQFADAETVKKRLFELGRRVRLESRVRAERDIAVAAASVLARAEFLRRLHALSGRWETPLHKGAGPPVVEAGRRFVRQHGSEKLSEVAKLHFKTTKDVIGG